MTFDDLASEVSVTSTIVPNSEGGNMDLTSQLQKHQTHRRGYGLWDNSWVRFWNIFQIYCHNTPVVLWLVFSQLASRFCPLSKVVSPFPKTALAWLLWISPALGLECVREWKPVSRALMGIIWNSGCEPLLLRVWISKNVNPLVDCSHDFSYQLHMKNIDILSKPQGFLAIYWLFPLVRTAIISTGFICSKAAHPSESPSSICSTTSQDTRLKFLPIWPSNHQTKSISKCHLSYTST